MNRIRDLDKPSPPDPDAAEVAARFGGGLPEGEDPYAERIAHALNLRSLGFTILPVKTNSKDPASERWAESTKNDPATFLRNPGTHNYGVLPPPGCFCWDVDKDVPEFLREMAGSLGPLPQTRTHQSPHGKHVFYRWPDDVSRPRGPMFGKVVTRWPYGDIGQGYVVGPGSTLTNGVALVYSVLHDVDIAELPRAWAQAALDAKPPRTKQAEARPLAEVVRYGEGERHEAIRDKAHNVYRSTGVAGAPLFDVMFAWYQQHCDPYLPPLVPEDEVRRAIGDVLQFPVDELSPPTGGISEPVPVGPLFDWLPDILTELGQVPLDPYLIERFVVNNGLTIVAGHPKTMKSMAVLQAGFAYAAEEPFLGLRPLTSGYPLFAYVTEEGSRFETKARLDALNAEYDFAFNRIVVSYLKGVRFDRRGLTRVHDDLERVFDTYSEVSSQLERPIKMLMAMDPLRDFFPPGLKWSENDAQVMGEIKQWCRALLNEFSWLSIVLVHHLRKANEGDTGLEMAGSGATYGAVDSTITWSRAKDKYIEDRDDDLSGPLAEVPLALPVQGRMKVETRGDATWKMGWWFNPDSKLFQREAITLTKAKTVEGVLRAAGSVGATINVIATETEFVRKTVANRLDDLVATRAVIKVSGGRGRGAEARFYLPEFAPPELIDDLDSVMVDPLHGLSD